MSNLISYNSNFLQNDTIPKIKLACSTLEKCKSTIISIAIPSDFSEGYKIRNAVGKINDIIRYLNSSSNSVNTTVQQIHHAEVQNLNMNCLNMSNQK